jgi:hypothetical protein
MGSIVTLRLEVCRKEQVQPGDPVFEFETSVIVFVHDIQSVRSYPGADPEVLE